MRWTLSSGRRLAGAASLGLPLAVVALVKVLGVGPLASKAAAVDESGDAESLLSDEPHISQRVALEPALEWPKDAVAAWRRADELRAVFASGQPSPFYRPQVRNEASPDEPARIVRPVPASIPPFVLSGVMNARPPIAVIDGEVRRAGDSIGEGWRVAEIDARRLTVTIRHEDGRTHQISAQP